MRGARREHPPQWGCDRRATKQMARRRPAPPGWGSLACWLRCSLLTDRCGYARRSRLASKPNSLQQNRNLFLNEPLASLIGADPISEDERRLTVQHFDLGGCQRSGFPFVYFAWFAVTFPSAVALPVVAAIL